VGKLNVTGPGANAAKVAADAAAGADTLSLDDVTKLFSGDTICYRERAIHSTKRYQRCRSEHRKNQNQPGCTDWWHSKRQRRESDSQRRFKGLEPAAPYESPISTGLKKDSKIQIR
jgi:hypothetical protein